jgi:hypothetical protein
MTLERQNTQAFENGTQDDAKMLTTRCTLSSRIILSKNTLTYFIDESKPRMLHCIHIFVHH